MAKKLNENEFLKRIKEIHNEDIEILGEYINRRTKILTRHKCGYEWEANPETLLKGHSCPKCSGNLKKNTKIIKEEVFNLVGDEYEVIGEYVNTHTPILFKHNLCGKEFLMAPKSFIRDGQRCPNERYIKSSKSNSTPFSEIIEKVKILGNGEYEIISEYIKSSQKVTFIHHTCGKTFELQPTRFIKGGIRCPHCYRSKGEEVIREFLKSQGYVFKEQFKIKECKNIRTLPFDFALFDKNKLICLIEYDGSQHFERKFGSSEEEFLKVKNNDIIKNNFCKENKIILIRIKYVRSDNPNIFKEKVINKLKEEFAKYNMTIPSQGLEETQTRCND